MSGSISYVFYAIEKPLSHVQREEVAKLSRRAMPTARRVDFFYNVEGYDLPAAYESLLAKYYDVMVRQDYEQWTLGMAWDYDAALYESLKPFQCDDGEGCGVRVEPINARYPRWGERKIGKPTRLLAEITAYLNYDALESLKGLRTLPWDRAPEDEDGEWSDEYEAGNSWDDALVQLSNCIREDVLKGDLRAFYLAWEKFHDPDSEDALPEPPKGLKKLPPYLKGLRRMLLASDER